MSEAADRAGAIVSEQIRAMLDAAENRALEIRKSAEEDARDLRQGAAREVGTLFQKLEELEGPLDALVTSLRGELDSLSSEFRRHWPSDEVIVQAVPDEPEPEAETQPQPPAEPEAQPDAEPQGEADAQPEPRDPNNEATAAHATINIPEQLPEEEMLPGEDFSAKRGPLSWLKRRKSATFDTATGQCTVCHHGFPADVALEDSGWNVSGELGVCGECQEDGWQLPEGARLPYRRAVS